MSKNKSAYGTSTPHCRQLPPDGQCNALGTLGPPFFMPANVRFLTLPHQYAAYMLTGKDLSEEQELLSIIQSTM